MLPGIGSLIYVNGNEAAIVIGYGLGADGADDGSVIVGKFAGAEQFEQGHFGTSPGVAGENPPSFVPESQQVAVATAGPVLATAGGTAVADVAGDAPASVVQTSEQASSGDPTIELAGPAVPGSTAVDFEAANAEAFAASDDERAEFEAWKASRAQPATLASEGGAAPDTTPSDAGSHSGL